MSRVERKVTRSMAPSRARDVDSPIDTIVGFETAGGGFIVCSNPVVSSKEHFDTSIIGRSNPKNVTDCCQEYEEHDSVARGE
jgi:hypothetical protein